MQSYSLLLFVNNLNIRVHKRVSLDYIKSKMLKDRRKIYPKYYIL